MSDQARKEPDYSFQIRDNLCPIVLVWDDLVSDGGICGDIPLIRENYKSMEVDYAAYLGGADQISLIERKLKWESAFTSM